MKTPHKKSISIVVTDSGLGGLSVCAEVEKNLREFPKYETVDLTFFNALKGKESGYNRMNTLEEKTRVFNSALEGMKKLYQPDVILIACNTLSVVYPFTDFAKSTDTFVLGIVKLGVNAIFQKLSSDDSSVVILFGTPTTISSGEHKKSLMKLGIDEKRIISQPCMLLESEIQTNPSGENAREMISQFAAEAKEKISIDFQNVYAALCCTHYGYSINIFEEELQNVFVDRVEIINPNIRMSNPFCADKKNNIMSKTKIEVNVVSKVEILEEEKESIGELIRPISPETYNAFIKYSLNKNLF